jgi:carboxyl-terminal processing protease
MSINQFNYQSKIQFRDTINIFNDKKCSKYIFDVRNNPGGVLDDVSYMLDYFVPSNQTIVSMKYKNEEHKIIASDNKKKLTDENIIILIN